MCALQAMQQQKHAVSEQPGEGVPWGDQRPLAAMAPSSSQEPPHNNTAHHPNPARKLPSAARRPAGSTAPTATTAFRSAAVHDPVTVRGPGDGGGAPPRGGEAAPERPKELPSFLRACVAGGGPSTSQVMRGGRGVGRGEPFQVAMQVYVWFLRKG